jgi:hypothetical protein
MPSVSAAARVLRPAEWGRLGGMAAVIVALNGCGWGIFVFTVMPDRTISVAAVASIPG